MMKLIHCCACVAALSALTARAADEESQPAETEEAAETLVEKKTESSEKFFRTLPLCRHLEGVAEVLYPGQTEWAKIEEGRFYPLGTTYRTTDAASKLIVEFGKDCQVVIEGVASFGTRLQGLDEKTRSISLVSGKFELLLPRNLPEKIFSVAAPGFTVTSAIGKSVYTYEKTGDGDLAVVRCVTGSLALKGRHFEIPAMRAANEIKIRTSQDLLFTGLYGTSGDYELRLDQGLVQVRDVENNQVRVEPKTLVWKLSPRTCARIHRARPAIGSRLSVTTMTFEPSGKMVNRCTFSEGRYELNTGEQGEIALKRMEEQSKKAAETAEAVTAPSGETPAETPAEGESSGESASE